jgi:hypothetical protein
MKKMNLVLAIIFSFGLAAKVVAAERCTEEKAREVVVDALQKFNSDRETAFNGSKATVHGGLHFYGEDQVHLLTNIRTAPIQKGATPSLYSVVFTADLQPGTDKHREIAGICFLSESCEIQSGCGSSDLEVLRFGDLR